MNKIKFAWVSGAVLFALGLLIRYFDETNNDYWSGILTIVWVVLGGVFVELLMQPIGRLIRWIRSIF